MDRYTTRNKALGAVIGSAVGDALGAPFEFGSAGDYSHRFPQPVIGGIGEMVGGRGWKPGEFTDDTQMAIVQAESLLANGGVNGRDLFDRFRIWASTAADVGIQTRAVLRSSSSWDEAAAVHFRSNPTRAAGNGSVMRAAMSAVFLSGRTLDESMAAAHQLSAVTHGDPAAGWGAALYHAMIHAELNDGHAFAALEAALDTLPASQARYRQMLSPTWRPAGSDLPNGSVWGCLAEVVWAVRTTTSFEEAIVRSINLGGDTDTVAAVAGGLAGAIYGIQNIPSRWSTYLNGTIRHAEGVRTYRLANLQLLTHSLLGATPAREQTPAHPAGPVEIAEGVHAANLAGAAGVPTDWAVVSLCRVGDRFANHPIRREVYLVDRSDGQNHALGAAVHDAVDAIDAFRAEGRSVVVHCHAGASRTGLVLLAAGAPTSHERATAATRHVDTRWPLLDASTNTSFTDFIHHWAATASTRL